MKTLNTLFTLILLLAGSMASAQTKLKVGDMAPDFTAMNEEGKEMTLSKLKGKKVVIYFYPKDFTPGCTEEACNLRDNYDTLSTNGYQVLGISSDEVASHKSFKEKYALPFPLIADPDKSIHQKYGVWVEKERDGKKYMGTARTTFVIDEKGKIASIIDKVDTKQHALQILKFQ